MPFITTTFQTYTSASIEAGDSSDNGFVDEEGELMGEGELSAVDEAIAFLKEKMVHPSSSGFHQGLFYTEDECSHDRAYFEEGETTYHSFHLMDFTEVQEKAVYEGGVSK